MAFQGGAGAKHSTWASQAIGPLLLEPALNARETQSDAPSDARSIDARSIAVGPSYSAIVTGGGALLVFGSNTGGRLGLSQTEFDARAIQAIQSRHLFLGDWTLLARFCRFFSIFQIISTKSRCFHSRPEM